LAWAVAPAAHPLLVVGDKLLKRDGAISVGVDTLEDFLGGQGRLGRSGRSRGGLGAIVSDFWGSRIEVDGLRLGMGESRRDQEGGDREAGDGQA
jgi:hypothetical protein